MAESKGKIQEETVAAVVTTTEETPHPADETSAPGPYEGLDVNRPPVSTNRPDVPIAQSLVGGAGAPQVTEQPPKPEELAVNYVNDDDKKAGLVVDAETGKPVK